MRRPTAAWRAAAALACGAAFGGASGGAWAQPERGERDYATHCAGCHGAAGRGDGPLARTLTPPPGDLTTLARRHGGRFPADRVAAIVDGREGGAIGAHGRREMPVWGRVFLAQAEQRGAADRAAEAAVRQRVRALVDHLERLQRP